MAVTECNMNINAYAYIDTLFMSLRLTAFVTKSFHQAKKQIFIDDETIKRAIDWMVSRQNSDGSFPEPGRVIHKDMQVNTSISNSLFYFMRLSETGRNMGNPEAGGVQILCQDHTSVQTCYASSL